MRGRMTRREAGRRLLEPLRASLPASGNFGEPATDPMRHLANRATFGASQEVLLEIAQLGIEGWINWQLDYKNIDDTQMESNLAQINTGGTADRAKREFTFRCLYSRRQLAWRMTWFLSNHFNTHIDQVSAIAKVRETEDFFDVCLSTFDNALLASAKSPAMVEYLNSAQNVAGSPNENYSREVMELHTLGVDNGYSESDVAEAARIFTGWNRIQVSNPDDTFFNFVEFNHDTGPKKLMTLGFMHPGASGFAGVQEGEAFLQYLAAHPNTADTFVYKLCQYFVADRPAPGLVKRVKDVFKEDRHLGATVRAMFLDPEFYSVRHVRQKVMGGFEFALSSLRRLDVQTLDMSRLGSELAQMHQEAFEDPPPTGYPEEGDAWVGAGNMLPRWEFTRQLMAGVFGSNFTVDLPNYMNQPYVMTAKQIVDELLEKLVDLDVPAQTRTDLIAFMGGRMLALPVNPGFPALEPHIAELIDLILRLPEAHIH